MRTLILAAAALGLTAAAASADTIVTKETEYGVYSAPVAGATPSARAHPAPDTTLLQERQRTSIRHEPSTTVIEQRQPAQVQVETQSRSSY